MARKPSRHKQKRLIVREILAKEVAVNDIEKLEIIMIGLAERLEDLEERMDATENLLIAKIKIIDDLKEGLMSLCVTFSEVICEQDSAGATITGKDKLN